MNTTTRRNLRSRKLVLAPLALLMAVISVFAMASPSQAAVQTYASSTRNGLWHSGNVNVLTAGKQPYTQIYFNDRTGDNYCTQLKVRVHQSNGWVGTFNQGSVCGGRTGTLTNYYTPYPGTYLTEIEVWTVRADGNYPSYVWSFRA